MFCIFGHDLIGHLALLLNKKNVSVLLDLFHICQKKIFFCHSIRFDHFQDCFSNFHLLFPDPIQELKNSFPSRNNRCFLMILYIYYRFYFSFSFNPFQLVNFIFLWCVDLFTVLHNRTRLSPLLKMQNFPGAPRFGDYLFLLWKKTHKGTHSHHSFHTFFPSTADLETHFIPQIFSFEAQTIWILHPLHPQTVVKRFMAAVWIYFCGFNEFSSLANAHLQKLSHTLWVRITPFAAAC